MNPEFSSAEQEIDLGRHTLGPADAEFCIVEFGDFECPYCRDAAPVLRRLVEGSDGRVRLVFRHFPLFTVHPFALTAALAAEAAGDRFWAMHDMLFAHQDRLTAPDLDSYARELGIGYPVTGETAQAYKPAIHADYASGSAVGVRGTPTLFVDGARYTGRVQLGDLRTSLGLDR